VTEIAERLRIRRAQARLLPAAVALASEVAESRRSGGTIPGDAASLVAEFAEMDARQRLLSRRARGDPEGYDRSETNTPESEEEQVRRPAYVGGDEAEGNRYDADV
jgi:hypothetical protein